jgi:hypothetical protein
MNHIRKAEKDGILPIHLKGISVIFALPILMLGGFLGCIVYIAEKFKVKKCGS